jgi:RNA polymerase sigma factor (sigma-70 family)
MPDLDTLIARAQDVDLFARREAFDELVLRFQDMAYGYAYALLGDAHLAQDAAQEAFMAAYEHLGQLQDSRAFPGWMRRIVFSQSTRLTRGKKVSMQAWDETTSRLASEQPEPSAALEAAELRHGVGAAIQELSPPQRTATVLYYINGYSVGEVAAFLETSQDAVKKQLQRARKQLKERMMDMVRDDLHARRPSQDQQFVQAVRWMTLLKMIAEESQLGTLEQMLVDGVDIDARDEEGRTMLHWAAQQGNLEAVDWLLARGASPTVPDATGRTPLQVALDKGYTAVADRLRLSKG